MLAFHSQQVAEFLNAQNGVVGDVQYIKHFPGVFGRNAKRLQTGGELLHTQAGAVVQIQSPESLLDDCKLDVDPSVLHVRFPWIVTFLLLHNPCLPLGFLDGLRQLHQSPRLPRGQAQRGRVGLIRDLREVRRDIRDIPGLCVIPGAINNSGVQLLGHRAAQRQHLVQHQQLLQSLVHLELLLLHARLVAGQLGTERLDLKLGVAHLVHADKHVVCLGHAIESWQPLCK
mmetsp:Transcript_88110/g.235751  ORF Transcript_88110/g.235751 Transcript_88110/m.235751 type:complete len:229 (-) Transcript_88110:49-735(-)